MKKYEILKKNSFVPIIKVNMLLLILGLGPHRPRSHSSHLSSSAPTHLGLEQLWQRREPRKHLTSTSSLVEAPLGGSTSSLSTGGVLSPEAHDFSHDEGFDSEEDSEHYEDFTSDNGMFEYLGDII